MSHDDDGFTLVELLLSAAILTIIMGAITGALITFLKNGAYTIERDDHSGGAAVLSSYLNRDLASSDAAPSTSPTPCAGAGTAVLTLAWTEWTATPAAPEPVAGSTWQSSYVVTSDPIASVGGGARFQLVRRLCPPTGTTGDSLLLRNLGSAAAVTVATTVTTDCPAGRLLVTLPSYAQDAAPQGYSYRGCLKGRLG